jgi:hypothetical protein
METAPPVVAAFPAGIWAAKPAARGLVDFLNTELGSELPAPA